MEFSWFGNTPDEIASTLRAMKIKGRKGSSCGCPLAKGMIAVTGSNWVGIGVTVFSVDSPELYVLPTACTQFTDLVDTKTIYDDLIL